jgi:phenylalanyl-tRNA synthetase alpha chain
VIDEDLERDFIDVTLEIEKYKLGHLHPVTQVQMELEDIFKSLGFMILDGPELESDYYNFEALNFPPNHPARDDWDTLYINDQLLLRTHTSPVQIRVMKSRKPPLAIVVPGRVYRPDALDASHSFMFHQIEGFVVDKEIKFSDLKGVLEVFAKGIFGKAIKMPERNLS